MPDMLRSEALSKAIDFCRMVPDRTYDTKTVLTVARKFYTFLSRAPRAQRGK